MNWTSFFSRESAQKLDVARKPAQIVVKSKPSGRMAQDVNPFAQCAKTLFPYL